ncbi:MULTISPECIES: DUF4044 domain-containing protein [unclassified Streptococcus]|nr:MULTISPECIES: DUF4044 domain-containing protein [unclassified Streptococcus]TWS95628.1 DUF4044 domain-containing protein [Streptococcus sp. sy018]TWT12377.1 DUF4044 domain-containing protein [Streptococcus sp. sy004]TWT16746.1 DUF4044 domain-containing protein [Streptococcus sp. sy010]
MAFGDNEVRKKTLFEKITLVVVVIMLLITIGAAVLTAISAISA